MFQHVDAYPGDPILSLLEAFLSDQRPEKVNLSIGLYYDGNGKIPLLKSISEATQRIDPAQPHTYLPMEGLAAFREAARKIVLGEDAALHTRTATIQSLGGSGAIHVAARFIKTYFPESRVWLSDPTWDNHRVLIEAAGVKAETYPYYDRQTNGVKFDEMLATLETLPAKSIVLMQPSCHNPTGVDLTQEQWKAVRDVLVRRNLIPFMDMAYQGFGDGIDEDAWPIRLMAEAGLPMFVSSSFSKNFSLYGQRIGALSVVCPSTDQAARVQGQLKFIVRQIYSSPPAFGAQLVSTVLNDASLSALWMEEVAEMRNRISVMRSGLRKLLESRVPQQSWEYLTQQKGMFSYTGISPERADTLRADHGIYLLRSGRMCVTGLTSASLEAVARGFAETDAL